MDIKNIIIFLFCFLIIMWLQHNDDLKFNKKRTILYEKIKIPLVSSLLIILIKDFDYNECVNIFQSIIVVPKENIPTISDRTDILNDVFIGPPDF